MSAENAERKEKIRVYPRFERPISSCVKDMRDLAEQENS